MSHADGILDAVESVVEVLAECHVEAVVIGAVALAAHHYVRQTEDIDLGVNADLRTLRGVARLLVDRGFRAGLREPDVDDPHGGVIDVLVPSGLVQIISYADRFPAVIEDALRAASLVVRHGSRLKIAPLPHLVALKLYAGGYKAKADIIELLQCNPDADIKRIRDLCTRYRLPGLDALLRDAGFDA